VQLVIDWVSFAQVVVLVWSSTTALDACKNNADCHDVSTICWKPLRRCISCVQLCAPGRPTQRICASEPRCNRGIYGVHNIIVLLHQSEMAWLITAKNRMINFERSRNQPTGSRIVEYRYAADWI